MGEGHSRAMYPENPGFCSSQPDKVQRAEPVSMEFRLLGCVNENCVFQKKNFSFSKYPDPLDCLCPPLES